MKLIIPVLILMVLSGLVVAEEAPGFENHQFFGIVTWDAGVTYKNVIAKVDGKEYSSTISELVCTDTCSGKYGYAETMNIQGSGTITFFLDDLQVATNQYVAWETTNFPIDISTIPVPTCEVSWSCSDWTACTISKQTRTCTRADQCGNVTTQKPAEEKTCVTTPVAQQVPAVAPKITPPTGKKATTVASAPKTTPTASTTEPVDSESDEESSNLIWWILGVVLLIGAIVAIVLVLKKKPAQQIPLQ